MSCQNLSTLSVDKLQALTKADLKNSIIRHLRITQFFIPKVINQFRAETLKMQLFAAETLGQKLVRSYSFS